MDNEEHSHTAQAEAHLATIREQVRLLLGGTDPEDPRPADEIIAECVLCVDANLPPSRMPRGASYHNAPPRGWFAIVLAFGGPSVNVRGRFGHPDTYEVVESSWDRPWTPAPMELDDRADLALWVDAVLGTEFAHKLPLYGGAPVATTIPEFRRLYELCQPYGTFFSRGNMKFSGDTMRNFSLIRPRRILDYQGVVRTAYGVRRTRQVPRSQNRAFWFDASTFARIFTHQTT